MSISSGQFTEKKTYRSMSIVVRSLPGTFKLAVVDGVVCQYPPLPQIKKSASLETRSHLSDTPGRGANWPAFTLAALALLAYENMVARGGIGPRRTVRIACD